MVSHQFGPPRRVRLHRIPLGIARRVRVFKSLPKPDRLGLNRRTPQYIGPLSPRNVKLDRDILKQGVRLIRNALRRPKPNVQRSLRFAE